MSDQKSTTSKKSKEKFRFTRLLGLGKKSSPPTSTIVVANTDESGAGLDNVSVITSLPQSPIGDNNNVVKQATTTTAKTTTTTGATRTNLNDSKSYNWLTKTKSFQKLVKWAFSVCDTKKEGKVGKSELYAGILLVHLSLSKYVGPAACNPPTVDVINKLFDASDDDKSGYIDEDEFKQIIVICFGQVTSRIVAYYALIIIAVPYLANAFVTGLQQLDNMYDLGVQQKHIEYPILAKIDEIITFGALAQKIVSAVLFAVAIPKLFDWIDSLSEGAALNTEVIRSVPNPSSTNITKKNI